jgi:sulfonate transport system ATP-binding protein
MAARAAQLELVQDGAVARAVASVHKLGKSFGRRAVLGSLDLEIAPGEFVALLGRSGSGKSTLLRALAGLDKEVTGEIVVNGTVAVAFQEPRLLPWRTVLANVSLGLRSPSPNELARKALDEVGLLDRADAWPLTLSGGEAQRVSLARALVREPDLVLLDEPFCALDALTRITMHELVLSLWASYRPAVLMVTHDVDEALTLADRALVLRDGQIAYEAPLPAERPRNRDLPDLIAVRNHLLAELGVYQKGKK